METFLIKAVQLIAALSLLVIIHELGHYLFARIFGIRAEKFYLFLKKSINIVVKVVQNTILMPFSTKRMHCINDIDSLLLHYIYNKSEMKQNIP